MMLPNNDWPLTLPIAGERQTFQPVTVFRAAHGLPDEFGVGLFAPSTADERPLWAAVLRAWPDIQNQLLAAMPPISNWRQLTDVPAMLAMTLEYALLDIGAESGLSREAVELAATRLRDALEPAAYELVHRHHHPQANNQPFDMAAVYRAVVDGSVFVSHEAHLHPHRDEVWQVRLVTTLDGLVGMVIETATPPRYDYVADLIYAFPLGQPLAKLAIRLGEEMAAHLTSP